MLTSLIPAVVQYACFNTILEIVCSGEGEMIVFEGARYGRNDSTGAEVCMTTMTRNCDMDVQHPLSRTCGGKRRCSLAVNTGFFGDPCGYEEFLTVTYKCVPESSLQRHCSSVGLELKSVEGGVITGGSGYLVSPNYPGKHYMDVDCTWLIRAPQHQTIDIVLYDFELNVKREGRCHDYLAVSKGNETLFKDCGALGKQVIHVPSNRATISFKTGQRSLTQRGFILQYTAVGEGSCSVIDVEEGRRVSYWMDDGDVVWLNASCAEGYQFNDEPHHTHRRAACRETSWEGDHISHCSSVVIGDNHGSTLSVAAAAGFTYQTSTAASSYKPITAVSQLNETSASLIGVVFGAVCGLLLLTVCFLVFVFFNKRRSGERISKKERRRMIASNLNDHVITYDVTADIRKCCHDYHNFCNLSTGRNSTVGRTCKVSEGRITSPESRCDNSLLYADQNFSHVTSADDDNDDDDFIRSLAYRPLSECECCRAQRSEHLLTSRELPETSDRITVSADCAVLACNSQCGATSKSDHRLRSSSPLVQPDLLAPKSLQTARHQAQQDPDQAVCIECLLGCDVVTYNHDRTARVCDQYPNNEYINCGERCVSQPKTLPSTSSSSKPDPDGLTMVEPDESSDEITRVYNSKSTNLSESLRPLSLTS